MNWWQIELLLKIFNKVLLDILSLLNMKSNKTIGTRSTTNVIDSTFAHPAKAAFA